MNIRAAAICCVLILAAAWSGCRREPAMPAYAPGLGEIMTLTQMRHTKLWLAGQAGNWPLAEYEVEELREGMEDAATYHPTHKDAPLPIDQLIDKMMNDPLDELEKAVGAHDQAAFGAGFDRLTDACNSCHKATNFGFNVVARPASNPYPNQTFEPPK